MITWTILAPLAAGVLAIRWTVRGWRARRAGEADLTALREDPGHLGTHAGVRRGRRCSTRSAPASSWGLPRQVRSATGSTPAAGSACRPPQTTGGIPVSLRAGYLPRHMTSPAGFIPYLPERIQGLASISTNLWWSWQIHAREMFRFLDPSLWQRTRHNPLELLPARRTRAVAGVRPRCLVSRALRRVCWRTSSSRWPRTTPGSRGTTPAPGNGPSPTSAPSSRCTTRSPSTPAASACSPAITARKPRTWGFRWLPSASST